MPGMILQNGLAQATGFRLAKSGGSASDHHSLLLDDLTAGLRAGGALDGPDPNPLHQRIIGYALYDQDGEAGRQAKTAHIRRICAIPPSAFYSRAYQRWRALTADDLRFEQIELALESRLFIGLTDADLRLGG